MAKLSPVTAEVGIGPLSPPVYRKASMEVWLTAPRGISTTMKDLDSCEDTAVCFLPSIIVGN